MAKLGMSLLLKDMREDDLVDTLLDYGEKGGWLRVHFRPARTDKGWRTLIQGDKGFPDIVFAHPKLQRLVIVECKSKTGSLSPEQKLWKAAFEAMSFVEYYVWKPKDLPEARHVLLGHLQKRQIQWS